MNRIFRSVCYVNNIIKSLKCLELEWGKFLTLLLHIMKKEGWVLEGTIKVETSEFQAFEEQNKNNNISAKGCKCRDGKEPYKLRSR